MAQRKHLQGQPTIECHASRQQSFRHLDRISGGGVFASVEQLQDADQARHHAVAGIVHGLVEPAGDLLLFGNGGQRIVPDHHRAEDAQYPIRAEPRLELAQGAARASRLVEQPHDPQFQLGTGLVDLAFVHAREPGLLGVDDRLHGLLDHPAIQMHEAATEHVHDPPALLLGTGRYRDQGLLAAVVPVMCILPALQQARALGDFIAVTGRQQRLRADPRLHRLELDKRLLDLPLVLQLLGLEQLFLERFR
ncbi:MAG: hypothetical protein MUC36_19550 [Planctomycetes bacterium]|nr:hypothetical protein [Planctomycetota bacterium]